MGKPVDLVQGTLDLLILKAIAAAPLHGWAVAQRINELSRDVLRVNGAEVGFLLSFGTAVNYLRAYYALDRQGPWAATKLLGRLMASAVAGTHLSRAVFQTVEADIECDGESLPFRLFPFFFAGTVERIALGFQPTYLGNRKRGYFHVVGGPVPARLSLGERAAQGDRL